MYQTNYLFHCTSDVYIKSTKPRDRGEPNNVFHGFSFVLVTLAWTRLPVYVFAVMCVLNTWSPS
jgi:hypothetical protein